MFVVPADISRPDWYAKYVGGSGAITSTPDAASTTKTNILISLLLIVLGSRQNSA